mmetsp:Transcript_3420/g.7088  ORF Transcript_3420/g.7088 Transcript_3420/m.7088 type:complete len:279 (+) Transcript_3420:1222-2058(+)
MACGVPVHEHQTGKLLQLHIAEAHVESVPCVVWPADGASTVQDAHESWRATTKVHVSSMLCRARPKVHVICTCDDGSFQLADRGCLHHRLGGKLEILAHLPNSAPCDVLGTVSEGLADPNRKVPIFVDLSNDSIEAIPPSRHKVDGNRTDHNPWLHHPRSCCCIPRVKGSSNIDVSSVRGLAVSKTRSREDERGPAGVCVRIEETDHEMRLRADHVPPRLRNDSVIDVRPHLIGRVDGALLLLKHSFASMPRLLKLQQAKRSRKPHRPEKSGSITATP